MATAGHFVTMTGVVFFYIMFYDSHREKKVSAALSLMVPRINKRVLYYIHKIIYLCIQLKKYASLPIRKARELIIVRNTSNYDFEVYEKKIIKAV
jgi:hypothetical protein